MKYSFVFILLFCFYTSHSQEMKPPYNIEEDLAKTGRIILEHHQYKVRDSANTYFTDLLSSYIKTEEGFENPLKEVNSMMRISDEKGKFHIYTWQIPDTVFEYRQHGLIAVDTRRGIIVTPLKDRSDEMSEPEFKSLKADNWYGAIYYKIIPVKKNGETYFTLLGFSPGKKIHRKVIDVLTIDKRGKPTFGERIFKVDQFMDKTLRKPPMRLILSYSGNYSASVNWNDDKKMIIMDHLAPPDPNLKGLYDQYGPDLSYDGLYWKNDWWNLEKDIKFNTGQDVKIVPPSKPVGPPKK